MVCTEAKRDTLVTLISLVLKAQFINKNLKPYAKCLCIRLMNKNIFVLDIDHENTKRQSSRTIV